MAKMVLPNLRTHVRLYSNKQILMHGGGMDSLAIPKAPGATAGFMATPRAAVKQEQAMKQEQVCSGQTTITDAFSKAKAQTTHAPNLAIEKRPREEEAGPMRKRTKQDHATDAAAMVADVPQCRHKIAVH